MKYVVAVSGGVDSAVLLHMLYTHSAHELIVAHVDHGIRSDSRHDAIHVKHLADQYNLPYVGTRLELGSGASEATARHARYAWLESVRTHYGAVAIATAHHQDDLLETAILNIMRGTGWRGLTSLRETADRYRPLLSLSKARLIAYALDHKVQWREDSTNQDTNYTRNYIRHKIVPRLSVSARQELLRLIRDQLLLRERIEVQVERLCRRAHDEQGWLRYELIMLPDTVALEILRQATGAVEPRHLRRLLHFVRTGRHGASLQLGARKTATVTRQHVILQI